MAKDKPARAGKKKPPTQVVRLPELIAKMLEVIAMQEQGRKVAESANITVNHSESEGK